MMNENVKLKRKNSCLQLKTVNGNDYICNVEKNSIYYCHPIISFLLDKKDCLDMWLDNNKGNEIEVEGIGYVNKETIHYYYSKLNFYKTHAVYSDQPISDRLSRKLSPIQIKSDFANTKQITFEVTDKCNMSCTYCAYRNLYNNYDKREGKYLDIKKAIKFIEYLQHLWDSKADKSINNTIFIGFYGGEPLLNFEFIREIIEYLKPIGSKYNKKFEFNLTTNGVLLDKYQKELVENNFQLLISLDGDEYSNSYRLLNNEKPSFAYIYRNIVGLQKYSPKYFEQRVNFNATIHNRNSIEKVSKYFKDQFNKNPMIGELNTCGISNVQKEKFDEMFKNVFQDIHETKNYKTIEKQMFVNLPNVKDICNFIFRYCGTFFNDFNSFYTSNENKKYFPTATCTPFSKKIFITANGKILPCERIGHDHSLGIITDNSVDIDFQAIASKYSTLYQKVMNQCQECYNQSLCSQCLFFTMNDEKSVFCKNCVNEDKMHDFIKSRIEFLETDPKLFHRVMKEVVIE